MKTQAFLTVAVLTALALPAGAQTLAATSSTTASSAVLVTGEQVRPAPNLREHRALAMAAFERPPARIRTNAFNLRTAAFEPPPLRAKEEWTSDDGLRMKGAMVAYKARF